VLLSLLYLIIVYENSERDLRGTLAELQLRNQEMDHYVYRVSHDLRAPLCSVTGLVNLSAEEEDPAVLRNYLTMIGSTVSKSDDFIQSVLTHSKVLNTQMQPTELHLDTLIRDSFGALRYLPGWDQVQLQVEMDARAPFRSDLFRLSIILNNLIANAIAFRNEEANRPSFRSASPWMPGKPCWSSVTTAPASAPRASIKFLTCFTGAANVRPARAWASTS
jgi:light-regulated signal transduction histidine kinase (bacteriophytochrome)